MVIGAGIAGPTVAMALQKVGIEPTVYETHPHDTDGLGVFLTLGSNGVHALRVLDADEPVLALGFPTPGITLRNHRGRRLGSTRTGVPLQDGTTSQTVRRADLYRVLHETAAARGVAFEYGRRLVAAHDTGDGVRAEFADGSEAASDLLVGCDGIHSTVRTIIDPAAPAPTYARLVGTGGYARGVAVDVEPGSYEMVFGRRAFFGYAREPGGEVWWFANLPRPKEPGRGELEAITESRWREQLESAFAGDHGPLLPLIRATPRLLGTGPIHAVPHLPTWHRGRMVVVGDAAHAPSPTSGQGASLAVEDAVVLARCLRDVPDPAAALREFVRARRPRVERIIAQAARINNAKAPGPVGRVVRDAMLPLVLRLTADSKAARETYGYRVDWGAPVTAPGSASAGLGGGS
nr:NAD(P)/FAD-dependent oxidoreductase [Actinopolymorpha cephalotaxi]